MTRNYQTGSQMELQMTEREQRRRIIDILTDKVNYILTKSADDNLKWGGTNTDLLEILRNVYIYNTFTDACGRPMSFISLTTQVFAIFNRHMPKNPYTKADRGEQSKGVRRLTMMERLRMLYLVPDRTMAEREVFWNTLIINAA